MKIFRKTAAALLVLLLTSTQLTSQTNPNCPDAYAGPLQLCNDAYDEARDWNDQARDLGNESCELQYQAGLADAIVEYVDEDRSEEWLEDEYDDLSDQRQGCEDNNLDSWVDGNIVAADGWNDCLCITANCDWYCIP